VFIHSLMCPNQVNLLQKPIVQLMINTKEPSLTLFFILVRSFSDDVVKAVYELLKVRSSHRRPLTRTMFKSAVNRNAFSTTPSA
jgi:hypothetical protein